MRIRDFFCTFLLCTCLLGMIVLPIGVARAGERADDLKKIVAQWQTYESRIRSFDVSCSGRETKTAAASTLPPGVKGVPADSDATFPITLRFALDAERRVIFEYNGQKWSSSRKAYVPFRVHEVFNAGLRSVHFPEGEDIPSAHLSSDEAGTTVRDVRTMPIRLAFCASHTQFGLFDAPALKLTNRKAIIDGSAMVVLQQNENEVWLDPARQYVPIRYYQNLHGKLDRFIEVDYSFDQRHGWLPKAWKNVDLAPSGELVSSMSLTVTKCTINERIPDEDLKQEYPPGTWVSNYISNERYLVREGGHKRPIRPGEFDGTNYDTLLRTEPGGSSEPTWKPMLIWVAVATLLASTVLIVYRLRVGRSAASRK